MPPEVPNHDDWFPTPDGLPQPDWPAINAWLRETVSPAQRDEAVGIITGHWLARLAAALGSQYTISSGEYYIVLSDLDEERRRLMGSHLDKACAHVRQSLGSSPPLAEARQWVIIRLPDLDTNFNVMPTLDAGGETAGDLTEFVGSSAYPFLYCAEEVSDGEFAPLVWPLTYHVLGHLPLPAWLRMAGAISLTASFNGDPERPIDAALMAEHRTRWNERSIQEFWSGRFFGDVMWQDLSTGLALALLNIIKRESAADPEALPRFLCEANAKDAGEAASQHVFGKGLAAFVTSFVGPGDWTPDPPSWEIVTTEEQEDV